MNAKVINTWAEPARYYAIKAAAGEVECNGRIVGTADELIIYDRAPSPRLGQIVRIVEGSSFWVIDASRLIDEIASDGYNVEEIERSLRMATEAGCLYRESATVFGRNLVLYGTSEVYTRKSVDDVKAIDSKFPATLEEITVECRALETPVWFTKSGWSDRDFGSITALVREDLAYRVIEHLLNEGLCSVVGADQIPEFHMIGCAHADRLKAVQDMKKYRKGYAVCDSEICANWIEISPCF